VNDHLRDSSRAVLWNTPDNLHGMRLRTTSYTLIGAIWLQFAEAFTADRSPERCGHCGRLFFPARQSTARSFCTSACKQADYRRRKGQ